MNSKVRKWGNSLGIRIPKPYAKEARLKDGTSVDLKVEEGCLIIRPSKVKVYDLRTLVSRITPRNRHKETDTGRPVGREVW